MINPNPVSTRAGQLHPYLARSPFDAQQGQKVALWAGNVPDGLITSVRVVAQFRADPSNEAWDELYRGPISTRNPETTLGAGHTVNQSRGRPVFQPAIVPSSAAFCFSNKPSWKTWSAWVRNRLKTF